MENVTKTHEMMKNAYGDQCMSRTHYHEWFKSVFLNRRAVAWYWALASIIPGRLIEKNLPGHDWATCVPSNMAI
jgi:hypothetical protein